MEPTLPSLPSSAAAADSPVPLDDLLNEIRVFLSKGKVIEARRVVSLLQQSPGRRAEVPLALAESALAGDGPKEVLRLLEGVDSPVADRLRGEALLRMGLLRESTDAFRRAIDLETAPRPRARAWLGLGLALARTRAAAGTKGAGRMESDRALRRALADGSRDVARSAARALAESSRARRDGAEAIHYLRRALLLDPEDESVRRLLGEVREESVPAEAARYYRGELARDGGRRWARAGLARLAAREGRLRAADAHWRKVVAHAPLDPAPRVERARLALAWNPPRRALAERLYREVGRLDPNHREANLRLGDAAWDRARRAEALPHYTRYLAASRDDATEPPDRARIRVRVAEILTEGDLSDPAARRRAESYLREARRETPSDASLRVAAARLARAQGDPLGARRHLLAARREAPANPQVPFEAALLALSLGDAEGADAHLASALAMERAPHVLAERARLALRRADYSLAASHFRELLSRDTRNDWALAGWAIALARSGRAARAVAAWDHFLSRVPASPEARLGKAEALLHLRRDAEARAIALPLARRKGDLGRTARGLLGASELVRNAPARARRRLAPLAKYPGILEDLRPLLNSLERPQ